MRHSLVSPPKQKEMLERRPSSHLAARPWRSLMELHPFHMTEPITAALSASVWRWIYSYLLIMFANYTEALFSPADGALTGSTNTFKFTGPDGQDATRIREVR